MRAYDYFVTLDYFVYKLEQNAALYENYDALMPISYTIKI
jgi:hypothetical protein